MKIILILVLMLSAFETVICQKPCLLTNDFGDFITITRYPGDNKPYLIKSVVATNGKSCYSESIDSNLHFFNYLLTHFSFNPNLEDLKTIDDSITLRKQYLAKLEFDSLFNPMMTEYAEKTINKTLAKDTITMNSLLNIAVKFFSIMKINDAGNYVGKICTGFNDIKKTEDVRRPFIEAFCFASIMDHIENPEFNLYNDFVSAIKQLYTINLGVDINDRLLRAQGAMYMLMRNNENLKSMLIYEYEKKKEYLPFVLQKENT